MTNFIAAVALVLFSATAALQDTAEPLVTVAIDTNVEGNSDSAVGAIDLCAELAQVGDSFTFDLVVMNISDDYRIVGYQFDIDYDPSVIEISDVISVDAAGSDPPDDVTIISRINSSGSLSFINLTEGSLPDQDGSFTVSALDGTDSPFPPANHESGDGVLARVTAVAVGTGTSDLLIPGPGGGVDGAPDQFVISGNPEAPSRTVPLDLVISGRVSVGEPCVAPPTPTLDVDGPDESPTPSPETTAPAETPPPTSTPSPSGSDGGDSDDGSDTLLVISVIAGIWVVAGVISAAWYILRRKSRGSAPTE